MKYNTQQQLLYLENFDTVKEWYKTIHNREINSLRTKQIVSAAKQSREYFRNANDADNSVKSLLLYYGVASLSRSLILLLKTHGGEETLSMGHGLITNSWRTILLGEPSNSARMIGNLEISVSDGLFTDLLKATKNQTLIYSISDEADNKIGYSFEDNSPKVTLNDLFIRIPDLKPDLDILHIEPRYSAIFNLHYNKNEGFQTIIETTSNNQLIEYYKNKGYLHTKKEFNSEILSADKTIVEKFQPQLIHAHINGQYEWMPDLHLAESFEGGASFSEICIIFMLSYFLGMLARYYPTHWMSLINGNGGDKYLPIIISSQNIIENVFPELIFNFIQYQIN